MKVSGVSYSSDRKLSRCEQQYSYNYEEKLQLKRKKQGLFRGDLGHQLLQALFMNLQDKTRPQWTETFASLVETRWNRLFDEEKEDYGIDFMDTLRELVEHYEDHWRSSHSKWTILHVEKEFELSTKFGFPVRWKADLVVEQEVRTSSIRVIRGHGQKRNGLVEHKLKKAIPDSEERILQPQVHSYAWLLGKVGIPINFIVWDYIRTEPVPRPKINKDGSLSIRKITTDQRGYLKSLAEAGIVAATAEDSIGLSNKLSTMAETLSLERVKNTPNFELGQNFVKDWIERARRAQATERPLRNWNYNCKFDCDFFLLCQADMVGKVDRNFVILKSYEKKPPKVIEGDLK